MQEQLRPVIGQERAVSPVVGVVLMVAAVVILGGVVAAFVTGMGADLDGSPQASFGFTYDDSTGVLTIAHEGGDTIDGDRISVRVDGTTMNATDLGIDGTTVSTGDEIDVPANDGSTVRVVWSDSNGESTTLLAKWEGPQA